MKFTLAWLRDHLETDASLEDISRGLTGVGLEVESIHNPAAVLKDFVVAEITSAVPHPNAAKLQVCMVNDGAATRQIVCGAANARAGLKVVLAREGVFIPGSGITIKKTKIRDVESNGMLCSSEELGLADASEGIIELPATAQPGSPVADALGAADPVIEIAITPNRADCLGVRGIARDLAAAGLGTLKPLPMIPHGGIAPSPITVTLATEHCPHFIGCHVRGVKNGPSPEWLKQRLAAIGLRPISALVDITNYITFTHGRPLHVFDAGKLSGNITVRNARDGEALKALGGKEYTLPAGATVIADDAKALAIAGIIGGEDTGCTDSTTDIFLEAAYFTPENIAATGRALEILSDARYRFERGVDPAFTETGALLALQLIRECCGGEASALVHAGAAPAWKRSIAFAPGKVAALGGVDVPKAECARILTALGFEINDSGDAWAVTPPSWRRDVEGGADLVEEILRIHGYDKLPVTPLPKPPLTAKTAINPLQKRVHLAKRLLASRGMLEVCSWSFLPEAQARLFGGGAPALKLLNPISADLDTMRPSLLPGLLSAARANTFRSINALQLFEVGAQFSGTAPEEQHTAAAGLRVGRAEEARYDSQPYKTDARPRDAFDAKADALALLEQLGVSTPNLTITRDTPPWYHPGRSGALTLGGKITLGYFGELHPAITQQFELGALPVAAFELLLEAIPQPRGKSKAKSAPALSAFQPVQRDFAFVVEASVCATHILRALQQASRELITQVQIFDVYTGKGVEEGKKSVALQVTLQAPDRTLSDADIAAASEAVINAARSFGGTLRQ